MNHNILGLMAFLTILSWVAVIYCIYLVWNTKKPTPNPIIGYVESMTEDSNGISVGFRIDESAMNSDGVRVIKQATIHDVSIVDQVTPGWQGRITHVDGKEIDVRPPFIRQPGRYPWGSGSRNQKGKR